MKPHSNSPGTHPQPCRYRRDSPFYGRGTAGVRVYNNVPKRPCAKGPGSSWPHHKPCSKGLTDCARIEGSTEQDGKCVLLISSGEDKDFWCSPLTEMDKNHRLLRVCPSVDQTVVSGAKSLSRNKPRKPTVRSGAYPQLPWSSLKQLTYRLDLLRLQASRDNPYGLEAAKLFDIQYQSD